MSIHANPRPESRYKNLMYSRPFQGGTVQGSSAILLVRTRDFGESVDNWHERKPLLFEQIEVPEGQHLQIAIGRLARHTDMKGSHVRFLEEPREAQEVVVKAVASYRRTIVDIEGRTGDGESLSRKLEDYATRTQDLIQEVGEHATGLTYAVAFAENKAFEGMSRVHMLLRLSRTGNIVEYNGIFLAKDNYEILNFGANEEFVLNRRAHIQIAGL